MNTRRIIVNIILIIIMLGGIICAYCLTPACNSEWKNYNYSLNFLPSTDEEMIAIFNFAVAMTASIVYGYVSAFLAIIILIFINIKSNIFSNLKVISNAEWQEYKQARAENKLTKKQARIAKLEKQLNELKKDGN